MLKNSSEFYQVYAEKGDPTMGIYLNPDNIDFQEALNAICR